MKVNFVSWNLDKFTRKPPNRNEAENQLLTQIIALLEHYKRNDPVGIPGSLVTDPLPVPDTKHSVGMGHTLTMINAMAYGISKFRIRNVAIDAKQLMV